MNDNMIKYMGGPWKILDECQAPRHNTARAGVGRSGGGTSAVTQRSVPCICPRGMALAAADKEKRRTADAVRDRRYEPDGTPIKRRKPPTINSGPMMYVGGAPWALNPDCHSLWHNTQRAAVGRSRNGRQAQCMCPRGIELRKQEKEKRLANGNGKRGALKRKEAELAAVAEICIPGKRTAMPDIRQGACRAKIGIKIVDELGAKVTGALAAHRLMCGTCPIKLACAAWATTNEGDVATEVWDGVYGGLMPAERKQVRSLIAGVPA